MFDHLRWIVGNPKTNFYLRLGRCVKEEGRRLSRTMKRSYGYTARILSYGNPSIDLRRLRGMDDRGRPRGFDAIEGMAEKERVKSEMGWEMANANTDGQIRMRLGAEVAQRKAGGTYQCRCRRRCRCRARKLCRKLLRTTYKMSTLRAMLRWAERGRAGQSRQRPKERGYSEGK